ncbi:MAG TPA: SMP-30/gluconolactonase/LRE family protein [Bryobacteraceae bacterium]|jgi:gluconolactonase
MKRLAHWSALASVVVQLLLAQDSTRFQVEVLAEGYAYTDGPAWSKDGFLIFSDTPADQLLKWVPGQPPAVYRENVQGPAGNAFDGQGRLYTCETRARRVTRTDKHGAIEVLADRWEGKRLNAPNDIVVGRSGHAYFTDPAFGSQADRRELDFYGVYHIPAKGPLEIVAKLDGRPNGIALSPNGRVLYVSDSDDRSILAFDLDHNGQPTKQRTLVENTGAVPDGIRVDEKGNLYVAARGIAVYTAEGRLLDTIPVSEPPSNCAFGEADGQSLFITARHKVYRVRVLLKGAGFDERR